MSALFQATDKLNSQLNRLRIWLSSDPKYILEHCGDILSVNENKKVIKQSSGSEQMRELLEIIIQKGEDICQNFIDTLRKHQGHFPQLKQFFVTEAEGVWKSRVVWAEMGLWDYHQRKAEITLFIYMSIL